MNCPRCSKEIVPDSVFCVWCSAFVPSPQDGEKANLFARWFALAVDPLVAVVLYFLGVGFAGATSLNLGIVAAMALPIVYAVWYLSLFRRGMTPGKKLLGLQVVNSQTGAIPGFGKMFLREIVGRFVSALFFGVGYFWAIFDKNAQAWHDKIAGTVVLKVASRRGAHPVPRGVGEPAGAHVARSDPIPAPGAATARPSHGPRPSVRVAGGRAVPSSIRPLPGLARSISPGHLLWTVPLALIGGLGVQWALGGGSGGVPAAARRTPAANAAAAVVPRLTSPATRIVEVPGTPERFRVPSATWLYATFDACALDRNVSYCFSLLAPDCFATRGPSVCMELHRGLLARDPSPADPDAVMATLRNLVTAEEAFFADSVRYTDRVSRLVGWTKSSPGLDDPVIHLTPDGWTATVRHLATGRRCAIFVGTTPLAPAVKEGEPRCEGGAESPRREAVRGDGAAPSLARDSRRQDTGSTEGKGMALDRQVFGRWRGTLNQPERPWAPFGIDLVILSLRAGESAGQGVVNNGDCTYDLRVERVDSGSALLRTAGVTGPCVSGVAIDVRPTPEGALHVRYLRPNGGTWMESTLTRFK